MGFTVQKSAINVARRPKTKLPKSRRFVCKIEKQQGIPYGQFDKLFPSNNLLRNKFQEKLQEAAASILASFVEQPPQKADTLVAEVLEIEGGTVLLHCLIDPEAGIFQTRRFDQKLFDHVPELEEGELVALEIESASGDTTLTIRRETNHKYAHLFDPDEILKSISTSEIFRPMSVIDESDL